MALQTSGQISLADIASEFGDSAPHSISEFYGAGSSIPSSGPIDFADFYGATSELTDFYYPDIIYQPADPSDKLGINYVQSSTIVSIPTASSLTLTTRLVDGVTIKNGPEYLNVRMYVNQTYSEMVAAGVASNDFVPGGINNARRLSKIGPNFGYTQIRINDSRFITPNRNAGFPSGTKNIHWDFDINGGDTILNIGDLNIIINLDAPNKNITFRP